MKKNLFCILALCAIIGFTACENKGKDTTLPVIDDATFLPADCDIYYLGDTLFVHFICSDDNELGNYNIEIHNNFDHHTHGTSAVDCDEDEHHHDEGEDHDHEHEQIEGAWVYNQDFAIVPGLSTITVDLAIPVPDDVLEGDYHFMLRLTDRVGWQTIKAVPIHLKNQAL